MKSFITLLKSFYTSFRLNLGIKAFLTKKIKESKYFLDQRIIYPLHKIIEKYIFTETVKHYGADYKWGDEKSQNLDKKTANYGYGLFHYSVVRNQKPKKILCVGSMYGYIPYMLAKACEDNGFGQVDFVDAGFSMNDSSDKDTHYFGQGFWKKEMLNRHFSYFLNPKYIKTYIMTTKDFAKKYQKNTYDYICLDGDHSYHGAKLDMKLFWSKLSKGGFLTFHDIHLEESFLAKEARNMGLEFGYKKIWQEVIKNKEFKFELSNHYSGLGFLQKL